MDESEEVRMEKDSQLSEDHVLFSTNNQTYENNLEINSENEVEMLVLECVDGNGEIHLAAIDGILLKVDDSELVPVEMDSQVSEDHVLFRTQHEMDQRNLEIGSENEVEMLVLQCG